MTDTRPAIAIPADVQPGDKFLRRNGTSLLYNKHDGHTHIFDVAHHSYTMRYRDDGKIPGLNDGQRDIVAQLSRPLDLSFAQIGDTYRRRDGNYVTLRERQEDRLVMFNDDGVKYDSYTLYTVNGEAFDGDFPMADIVELVSYAVPDEAETPQDATAAAIDRLTALLAERLPAPPQVSQAAPPAPGNTGGISNQPSDGFIRAVPAGTMPDVHAENTMIMTVNTFLTMNKDMLKYRRIRAVVIDGAGDIVSAIRDIINE